MRDHDADPTEGDGSDETTDHVLFWPIGQEMLAEIARELLDQRLPDVRDPSRAAVKAAFAGLGQLEWELHQPPWRYFMLTQDERGWRMRSEERAEVVKIGQQIQQWVIGLDERPEEEVTALKDRWATRLIPAQSEDEQDGMWRQLSEQRAAIAAAATTS